MLEIKNLVVTIQGKKVLNGVSFGVETGNNTCILGKNGSGKSSLAMAIMGHPEYEIESGDILINKESILELEPHERSKLGIFLAFQKIPEVKGVKLFEFLRTIYNARRDKKESFVSFKRIIVPLMEELSIDKEFLRRDLNVGFSGGERRKIEIIQLRLLQPTYIFLDEVDSGLDVDAFRSVAGLLKILDSDENSFVVITHYFTILDYLEVNEVVVLENGSVKEIGTKDIVERIKNDGFGS